MAIEVKNLKELIKLAKLFDLAELEIESKGDRVRIKRSAEAGVGYVPQFISQHPSQPPSAPVSSEGAGSAGPGASDGGHETHDKDIVYITSPFVGTFYRAPAPDAPNFVEEGHSIKPGQVLCIVEAMKLMNEIESELSGSVLEVLVQNGKSVEYGDKLFKIKKA